MEQSIDKLSVIRGCAKRLRLSCLTSEAADVLINAQKESPSYDDFLLSVLMEEVKSRDEKQLLARYKAAKLPLKHSLDEYDPSIDNGLSVTQLRQLRELHWVEEGFNIMLAGPCGVGKTYIAAGLCADAIEHGYRAYFRSMDEILSIIKLKEMTPSSRKEYRDLCSCHILAIDDLMNLTVDREDGNLLFSFINKIYESTSIIITTNRSPVQWAQALNDEVLATAILDRLLYKCELLQLGGQSYRMANRRTIFPKSDATADGDKPSE